MNKVDRLKEIYDLLDNLNVEYETHHHKEEGEYQYLKDNDLCITVKNPHSDNQLYIDYVDEEITISYYKWHAHYFDDPIDYYVLPDIKDILNNQKCLIIINSTKRWLSSNISNELLDIKFDYQSNIKSLPKEFIQEINEFGGTVELFYWNPNNSITIKIEPKKIRGDL